MVVWGTVIDGVPVVLGSEASGETVVWGTSCFESELRTGHLEQPMMTARVRSSDPAACRRRTLQRDHRHRRPAERAIVEEYLAAGAGLRTRGHRRGCVQYRCLPATQLSAPAVVRVPAGDVLSDLRLEVNLPIPLASGSTLSVSYAADLDDAAAARTAGRRSRGGCRRLDAVHREGQTAVSTGTGRSSASPPKP